MTSTIHISDKGIMIAISSAIEVKSHNEFAIAQHLI